MGELIGHGSFANVYRGNFHDTEVAIKVIKFVSLKDMEKSLLEEAGLMVKLRHPHIVLFMGAGIKMPDLFIVTEFMANGSVRELLDKKEVLLEPEHIKKMCIEACKGMAFLHSRKIIHRDLKTHNLLVDKYWSVKVADFGLSRAMGDTDGTMTACGTPSWAAPEVLRRDHYSYKADVYSFGICLWEMNTRKRPYSNLKPYQVVIAVATDGLRPDIEGSIPSYFEKLIRVCWNDVPAERPDFPKLREMFEEVKCPEPKYSNPTYTKAAPDLQGSQSLPNLADKNGGSSKQFN
uniref:Protein kinase domain-containing protein n=1 Tax=Arcella intermedia TaxID=1963864 RepID=A0A6B2LBN8_9EUKA